MTNNSYSQPKFDYISFILLVDWLVTIAKCNTGFFKDATDKL